MSSGETILKITDYPFSYSLIVLVTTAFNLPLSTNNIILLGLAGALGTFLTFIDPIGIIIRYRASQRIDRKEQTDENMELHVKQYETSSLNSKSISFEIDKIVGLVYFVSLIIIFLLVVWIPNPFFPKLIILNAEKYPLWELHWFQIGYTLISIIVLTILGIKGTKFWNSLDEKIMLAGFHQRAIGNQYATRPSLENLTRTIEQNDWDLSKLWKEKIDDEIRTKKGKQELVLKAAEIVYEPLYQESRDIRNRIQYATEKRSFSYLDAQNWERIKNESKHLMVEKPLLNKIEDLYTNINRYNILQRQNNDFLKKIILENVKSIFGENVFQLVVHIGTSESKPDALPMYNCLLHNLIPTKYFRPDDIVVSIRLDYVENKSNKNQTYHEPEYIDKFWKFWENTSDRVEHNAEIKEMRELWDVIKKANIELLEIYEKEISLQY